MKTLFTLFSQKEIGIIGFLLLLNTTFFTVHVSLRKQTRQSQAAITNQSTSGNNSCPVIVPVKVPVVVLGYFPPDPNDPIHLDQSVTGIDKTDTIAEWQLITDRQLLWMYSLLNEATQYHGYKDPFAQAYLNYVTLYKKYYASAEPLSTVPAIDPGFFWPNYNQILTGENICNAVDNQGAKEVWIYAYQGGKTQPSESRMSSAEGNIANSVNLPPQFDLPRCQHSYVLYNYIFNRLGNSIHDRIHQFENVIPYVENQRPPSPVSGGLFWGNFADIYPASSSQIHSTPGTCGNAHYAPNWQTGADAYNFSLSNTISSNCENWNPVPANATYKTFSCTEWNCNDLSYYIWWMQNVPGFNSNISYQGQQLRNWWDAMYDFDGFLAKGKTLLQTPVTCSVLPSPTPAPAQFDSTNLALNKPATSNRTDPVPGHEPSKAVNGDTTTPGNSWEVNNPLNAGDWWQVDLGSLANLGKIVFYPNSVNYNDMCRVFHVDVSATGLFTGEQKMVIGDMDVPLGTNPYILTYIFPETVGRYIRFTCDQAQWYMQLQQVQVYAYAGPTPPQPTTTISPGNTALKLTICPHGIANCGDNANASSTGNLNPLTMNRQVTVSIADINNNPLTTAQGTVMFDSASGTFKGTVPLSGIASGQYIIKLTMPRYLTKILGPSIVQITQGQINSTPEVFLVAGDINGDNKLDILDYSALVNCFGSKQNTSSCQYPTTADINDDGIVDGVDYNLFLRELSVQNGQ